MPTNPYAPPGGAGGAPAAYGAMPQSFPFELTTVVSQLTGWMRFLSVVYYIACGLLMLMVIGILALGAELPGLAQPLVVTIMAMFAAFAVLGVLAATWLMQAAGHFKTGVHNDDAGRLFQGFRSFRLYLIVYVIWSSVSLLGTLVPLAYPGVAN